MRCGVLDGVRLRELAATEDSVGDRSAARASIGPRRKNYLFPGHDEGAENLATLMSLVVTCEAHGINPEDYLADVLLRVQDHPQSRIDELLPPAWNQARLASNTP